ncbi:MAG: hypothetical protein ACE5FA_10095 [Dehalococcoidia bacterium]
MNTSDTRAIGPIGTLGRFCLGCIFLYVAFFQYGVGAQDLVLGFLVFPVVLVALQRLRLTRATNMMNATGPVGFIGGLLVALLLFVYPPTRVATLLFYGISLLIAAVRGYAGCEVLAISNWLLRRDDQVGCVVFSPLDALESQLGDNTPTPE